MLNDLWRYRINDSTWTWVSGSNTINHPGVYGEKGIPNTNNMPRARSRPLGWYDSLRQEFWLFGGEHVYSTSASYGEHTTYINLHIST